MLAKLSWLYHFLQGCLLLPLYCTNIGCCYLVAQSFCSIQGESLTLSGGLWCHLCLVDILSFFWTAGVLWISFSLVISYIACFTACGLCIEMQIGCRFAGYLHALSCYRRQVPPSTCLCVLKNLFLCVIGLHTSIKCLWELITIIITLLVFKGCPGKSFWRFVL